MSSNRLYISLAIVFAASFMAAKWLPPDVDWVRDLAAIPAIGALFSALFVILRDRIAHERSVLMIDLQNTFSIGATSHMANVAFDKHVEFCETYTTELYDVLINLFKEGPSKKALEYASRLRDLRQQWSLWITLQVDTDLENFESAIRKIGADGYLIDAVPGAPGHEKAVNRMMRTFADVMGAKIMGADEWQGEPLNEELAAHTVMANLQKVLGIEQLTALRTALVNRALENL
jgi:hypothetical protein